MLGEIRQSTRPLKASLSNFSEPWAMKLLIVPAPLLGRGSSEWICIDRGDMQFTGITLPRNCTQVAGTAPGEDRPQLPGSNTLIPYSLRFPVRARSVGTLSSFEPPSV